MEILSKCGQTFVKWCITHTTHTAPFPQPVHSNGNVVKMLSTFLLSNDDMSVIVSCHWVSWMSSVSVPCLIIVSGKVASCEYYITVFNASNDNMAVTCLTFASQCSRRGTDYGWISLTHWGRVTHICVSKLTIIGSDNGLLLGWHQAII